MVEPALHKKRFVWSSAYFLWVLFFDVNFMELFFLRAGRWILPAVVSRNGKISCTLFFLQRVGGMSKNPLVNWVLDTMDTDLGEAVFLFGCEIVACRREREQ